MVGEISAWIHPVLPDGKIGQGKEGIKFCHPATLVLTCLNIDLTLSLGTEASSASTSLRLASAWENSSADSPAADCDGGAAESSPAERM